ncbi:MAG: riboflavin synthase [Gammaproteobacteria bacterium CG11_big_fil_rev_8_21_14_0_20_46_22]|nr:MAG: riboflavin synthase [Gammaproteobacteria bacterium CG12_big_fil_rev_8_21_14_0_65_46_12]PIR11732.1 MAG: riboflavin synthase [Gammaproteobacteria bacterium CG11_big_fil_rev_8_21_14_0_20_46_22]
MFTGIVNHTGIVQLVEQGDKLIRLKVSPQAQWQDIELGESIAINGVCLTVTAFDEKTFLVDVVPETLRCTTLGDLVVGSIVNLERALLPTTRMGGHFVQGHIDATTEILDIHDEGEAWMARFNLPKSLAPYIVHKGFIAIDGMSLTIAACDESTFSITFIPHTQAVSIVKYYKPGCRVNIEVDLVAKYIEKQYGKYHE